jgi:2-C-methyl-D-erythritol 2,4-cyclodiphosphate synthase
MRVGIGHDTHRLTSGGPLRLGGIDIPHDHHLLGHSDADALLHAITDALLGAASLGDIGELYPDTDPANRGRNSAVMLQAALEKVVQAGFRIVNIDCIIFTERPKLTPHKLVMRDRIAEILKVPPSRVGIKAKTGENVGIVGREEAIVCECVALLEETSRAPS